MVYFAGSSANLPSFVVPRTLLLTVTPPANIRPEDAEMPAVVKPLAVFRVILKVVPEVV